VLGAQVEQNDGRVQVTAAQLSRRTLVQGEQEPSSVLLFIAPLLVRRGYARLEMDFPLSRVRTHLDALRELGIDVASSGGAVDLQATTWERRSVLLQQASVTATAMVMMLAACNGRETVIENAACEPQLQELAHLLTQMGVRIDGVGSNRLTIFGASALGGAHTQVRTDHIEVASIAAIAAMCGGRIEIHGVHPPDLRMIEHLYGRVGVQLDIGQDALFVPHHPRLVASNREEDADLVIESAPWPGFPSDLIAMATVLATQARGTTLIHEKLYANRLLFIDKLKAMGAQIVLCDPHRAIVMGASALYGTYLDTPDIRTGLGMVAAALVAEGETVIDNAQVLEYTFAGVVEKLRSLQAQIEYE
jgi:UDP-N-acetylglucosamine 1-carboxyvinyltransferase